MKKSKRNLILLVSVVLMLFSCIFASMIQTNFGKVQVKEINWVTHNGYTMNAWLFIPENATAETPAPAVVVSHGMFNNKSMQDLNFVELAAASSSWPRICPLTATPMTSTASLLPSWVFMSP